MATAMADEPVALAGVGSTSDAPVEPHPPSEVEDLKARIISEIEAKLLQKEESLWKRGQVEIRKLQQEQQQVMTHLGKLQERQVALVTESQQLRGAVLDLAGKFEHVVRQLQEVVRAHHQAVAAGSGVPGMGAGRIISPTPSVASTAASEAGRDEGQTHCEPTPGTATTATPGRELWSTERVRAQGLCLGDPPSTVCGAYGGGFDPCEDPATFLTPPRAVPGGLAAANGFLLEDHLDLAGALAAGGVLPPVLPPCWRGGAVLSLADALPSTTASASATPAPASAAVTPSPGLKRLHLAECLDQEAALTTPVNPARLCEPSPSKPSAGGSTDYFSIELVKEPGFVTMGIEVQQLDSSSLRVECIDEHGLVGVHNARQESDATRVRLGDRIVEANGIRHNPPSMLQECKVSQRVVLTIARDRSAAEVSAAALAASLPGVLGEAAAAFAPPPTPPRRRMRPEAEVFVPSSQKEPASTAAVAIPAAAAAAAALPAAAAAAAMPPPGLGLPEGFALGGTATAAAATDGESTPQAQVRPAAAEAPLITRSAPAARGTGRDAPEDLVKRLFH